MLDIQHTQAPPDLIRSFLTTHTASLLANGAVRWILVRIERSPVVARFAIAVVTREGSPHGALTLEFEAPVREVADGASLGEAPP